MAASFLRRLAFTTLLALACSPVPARAQSPTDHLSDGPPPNLQGGVFRPVVDTMWQGSPTFRRQCVRIASAQDLVVAIFTESLRKRSVRAWTEIHFKAGAPKRARIFIASPDDLQELIAHELEHVIEQLDGVFLPDHSVARSYNRRDEFESRRATEIGRRVASEMRQFGGRTVIGVEQREASTGSLGPALASLSGDGSLLVFSSRARLVPGDVDDDHDVYSMDVRTRQVELESGMQEWARGYIHFVQPRVSADGTFVVVLALPSSSERGATTFWQIVVLDRRSRSARLVSAGAAGAPGNGHSDAPAISADGGTIAFESAATNLVNAHDANGVARDIYVARQPDWGLIRASVPSGGDQSRHGASVTPALSGDGRYVAFTSTASLACTEPTCVAAPERLMGRIYVRDVVAGLTTDISMPVNDKAVNGPSSWPSISADGRYVVFASDASNLVRHDGNRRTDVFLHDRVTRVTELVSRRGDGSPADGPSRHPVISGDGSTIAFQSLAPDLLCVKRCSDQQLEINMLWDVFLLDRSTGTMVRASGDADGEWMEPSRSPRLNDTGSVLVFASRHPLDRSDVANDDDLFVWMRV